MGGFGSKKMRKGRKGKGRKGKGGRVTAGGGRVTAKGAAPLALPDLAGELEQFEAERKGKKAKRGKGEAPLDGGLTLPGLPQP